MSRTEQHAEATGYRTPPDETPGSQPSASVPANRQKLGTLVIGATAGGPAVVTIWQGMREFFRGSPVEIDFVLYSNYPRMTDALLSGHIDIAWNLNLAWAQTVRLTTGRCRALAMRDTDLAFKSIVVARAGAGLTGLDDLRGRRIALGYHDSAQAAILPLHYLHHAGLPADQLVVLRPETGFGVVDADAPLQNLAEAPYSDPHGEAAAVSAVRAGHADAAVIGQRHWEQIASRPGGPDLEIVWETPPYPHCIFTALDTIDETLVDAWLDRLYQMDWDNPQHRPLMELEWVHRWVPPVTAGYDSLFTAITEQEVPTTW